MKAALIVMTLMGCDNDATQCNYIDTVDKSWQTVALCDAQAETYLSRQSKSDYPVVVAVCQSVADRDAETEGQADVEDSIDETANASGPAAVSAQVKSGLAERTLDFMQRMLPDASSVKHVFAKPVHSIEDGYAWVVRRFAD